VVTTNDGITTILKPRDQLLARIEWGSEPTVEIREGCSRQRASQWLPLSQDQRYDWNIGLSYPISDVITAIEP
jgi:hypothetical protein